MVNTMEIKMRKNLKSVGVRNLNVIGGSVVVCQSVVGSQSFVASESEQVVFFGKDNVLLLRKETERIYFKTYIAYKRVCSCNLGNF